jgi:TonB family protein
MKQKINFSMIILSTVIVLGFIAYSCTNNDMNENVAVNADATETPAINNEPVVETETNMAKPDPAKKGLKGKAIVSTEPLTKAGAKMEVDESGIYPVVEIMASFPEGYKGLQNYFDTNLEYPEEANDAGVDGTVRVAFIVDENGKLISPQVLGGKLGYGLEEEALRVISKMPAWYPAQVKGKAVKTRIILPIRFELA